MRTGGGSGGCQAVCYVTKVRKSPSDGAVYAFCCFFSFFVCFSPKLHFFKKNFKNFLKKYIKKIQKYKTNSDNNCLIIN